MKKIQQKYFYQYFWWTKTAIKNGEKLAKNLQSICMCFDHLSKQVNSGCLLFPIQWYKCNLHIFCTNILNRENENILIYAPIFKSRQIIAFLSAKNLMTYTTFIIKFPVIMLGVLSKILYSLNVVFFFPTRKILHFESTFYSFLGYWTLHFCLIFRLNFPLMIKLMLWILVIKNLINHKH